MWTYEQHPSEKEVKVDNMWTGETLLSTVIAYMSTLPCVCVGKVKFWKLSYEICLISRLSAVIQIMKWTYCYIWCLSFVAWKQSSILSFFLLVTSTLHFL